VAEELGEKPLQLLPRLLVRRLVVRHPLRGVIAGFRHREAVDGALVPDEPIVHPGLLHLLLERRHLLGRDEAIGRPVQDQYLRFDDAGLGGNRGVEPSVEADDAQDVSAAAGQLQHGRAPETVADRRDARRIDEVMLHEDVQRREDAAPHELPIVAIDPGELCGFLVVVGPHALAVHVHGEREVAQLCQLLRPALGVVVEPLPFVHDEHRRPFPVDGVIIGEVALQPRTAVSIFENTAERSAQSLIIRSVYNFLAADQIS
jgi:hypothetical protein